MSSAGSLRPPLSAPTGPTDFRPWAVLKVPPHHALMLSLQEHNDDVVHAVHCTSAAPLPFTLYYGNLTSFGENFTLLGGKATPSSDGNFSVFDGNVTSSDGSFIYNRLLTLVCGVDVSFPKLLSTDVLLIHYDSPPSRLSFGERRVISLRFSFHHASEVPEKVADGRWNCSVPHWPHFRQHFPCDLEWQCQNGEDESDCFYTTDKCGSGFLTVDGSCYFVVNLDHDLPWIKAKEACADRGGDLMSLNSPEEVEGLTKLLMLRPWMTRAFVGLRPARSDMPHM